MQGDWPRALDVADRRCADPDVDQSERGRLLAETVVAEVYRKGPRATYERAADAIAIAERSDDALALTVAHYGQAIAGYFDSNIREPLRQPEGRSRLQRDPTRHGAVIRSSSSARRSLVRIASKRRNASIRKVWSRARNWEPAGTSVGTTPGSHRAASTQASGTTR